MQPPYDRTHISADLGPKRDIASVRWFVVHDTEGSFPGDESVLTSAAPPVESVHFLIGREPGQCVLVVPLDTTAWTAGNDQVSVQAIQVELSRNPARGETDYTDYQYTKLAEVFNWCASEGMVNVPAEYIGRRDADGGPEPDVPGIIGHQDVPDPDHPGQWGGTAHHTDPGPTFDWNRLIALIKAGATNPSPPGTPASDFTIDGYDVGAGVHQLYYAVGADTAARLRIFGKCLGPQHDEWLIADNPDANSPLRKVALPVFAVRFERNANPVIWDRGRTAAPWDVRFPLATEHVGPADDPEVDAVLKAMQIAQQ